MASQSDASGTERTPDSSFRSLRESILRDLDQAQAAIEQVVAQLDALSLRHTQERTTIQAGTTRSNGSKNLNDSRRQQITPSTSPNASASAAAVQNAMTLKPQSAKLRSELEESRGRIERSQMTDSQISRQLRNLCHFMESQWALTDYDMAIPARQLTLDIQQLFTSKFFKTGVRSPDGPYDDFLSFFDAVDPERTIAWDTYILDVKMRPRIMQLFTWQFLLKNVFGRFLWLGHLAIEAQNIAAAVDPGEYECREPTSLLMESLQAPRERFR